MNLLLLLVVSIFLGALALYAPSAFSAFSAGTITKLRSVDGKSRAQKKRSKQKGKGSSRDSEPELGSPLTWEQCCLPIEDALARSALRHYPRAAAIVYAAALAKYKDHKHRRETMARIFGSIPDLCSSAERRLNRLKPHADVADEGSAHGEHILYIGAVCL
jgi:hypothetical protein